MISRIRDGEELAATLLYQRYARRLFGFVSSKMGQRLKSASAPEDFVQSIFRSVFRKVQSGHYDAPPGSTLWNLLAVVAVRKLRYHARQMSAQRRDTSRNVPLSLVDEETFSSITPEELELSFREAIESLRESDREILTLRLQQHSVEEISGQTGRSLRTIERSLQRIRRHFSEQLLSD